MKILVVDDMDSWRKFHENILEEIFIENGCTIHTANFARDGLDKIYENSSTPYDLIITDLQMEDDFLPQYAGEWFVEQIQNMPGYKKTRIIISSGCYNIRQIAATLNVECIPKRLACTNREEYERIVLNK